MKKNVIIVILLIGFILSSCVKNDIQEYSYKNQFGPDFYTNPNNPYDYVGQIHNNLIEYYNDHRIYNGTNFDSLIYEMVDLMSDYLVAINPDSIEFNVKQYYFNGINNEVYSFLNGRTNKNIIESVGTNDYFKEKACELQTFVGFASDNGYNNSQIVDSIKIYENNIINDPNLSQTEKYQLLSQSSIARHSLKLWSSYLYDPNSSWNLYPINSRLPSQYEEPVFGIFGKICKWLTGIITLVIPTTPERALIGVGVDAGVGLISQNPWAAGGVSCVSVIVMNLLNWP